MSRSVLRICTPLPFSLLGVCGPDLVPQEEVGLSNLCGLSVWSFWQMEGIGGQKSSLDPPRGASYESSPSSSSSSLLLFSSFFFFLPSLPLSFLLSLLPMSSHYLLLLPSPPHWWSSVFTSASALQHHSLQAQGTIFDAGD